MEIRELIKNPLTEISLATLPEGTLLRYYSSNADGYIYGTIKNGIAGKLFSPMFRDQEPWQIIHLNYYEATTYEEAMLWKLEN